MVKYDETARNQIFKANRSETMVHFTVDMKLIIYLIHNGVTFTFSFVIKGCKHIGFRNITSILI